MPRVTQSVVIATLLAVLTSSQTQSPVDCNYIDEFPIDVCRNTDSDESQMFKCVNNEPKRWDYDSADCNGDPEQKDLDEVSFRCDADSNCDYLKVTTNIYQDASECDGSSDFTQDNIRVVNKCVGDDNDVKYLCNEDQTNFYVCNCDDECETQDEADLGKCRSVSIAAQQSNLEQCPASDVDADDIQLDTPSPVASADCNFYDETPTDVCFEISDSSGTKSRKYVCDGMTPRRYTYKSSNNCQGEPDKDKDMSGEGDNYQCGASKSCDYLMIENAIYTDSGVCDGSIRTNSEARATDACVGDGLLYRCTEDDLGNDNFEVCNCDGENCEEQSSFTFGECAELAGGEASTLATLKECSSAAGLKNGFQLLLALVAAAMAAIAA